MAAVPSDSDAAIIASSATEPAVFATIFDRHAVDVHRYLERRVGRDLADDLMGEVFRIAFESRKRFRAVHDSARPWLFGIASKLILKHRRSEVRRLRALTRAPVDGGSAGEEWESVDQRMDAQRAQNALATALLALSPGDRGVVTLVAFEEFTYEEVAVALAIPIGTVRSRLNRARKHLRELVPEIGNEPVDRTKLQAATDGQHR